MLEDEQTTMLTTMSDYETMWCPRVVHKTVEGIGWTFKKNQPLQT